MKWIDRAYSGQARLWQVFWIGYVAVVTCFGLAYAGMMAVYASPAVFGVWGAGALAYKAYIALALWRCAPNTAHASLAALARVFAAFLMIAAVGGISSLMGLL